MKIVNADGEDYPNGFAPDVTLEDRFEVLTPLGDINEPLLSSSLAAIGVLSARQDGRKWTPLDQTPLYNSMDRKVWRNKILAEEIDIRP